MRRFFKLLIVLGLLGAAWVLLRELFEQPERTPPPATDSPGPSEAATPAKAAPGGDAAGASKAELYERAKRLGIEGRSKMSKSELAAAVSRAEQSAA